MTESRRTMLLIGSVLMFTAVLFGAFGSHLLKDMLLANGRLSTFETANSYHFYHALAILIVGGVSDARLSLRLLNTSIILIFVGVVLFSGSLYILALVDMAWLGAFTPVGGVGMLLGWGILSFGLIRPKK